MWYQIRTLAKKPHVSSLIKFDTSLHKTQQDPSCIKVPRLDMCRPILCLSKIRHQMWCNHPKTQGNKKNSVGGGKGVDKICTKGEGVGNIVERGLHKIRGRDPLPTMNLYIALHEYPCIILLFCYPFCHIKMT